MEKEKKLRILAAGDLHGDSKISENLSKKAEKVNVDLIILSGDITSPIESENLLKPFKKRNQKVLLLPGNWDSFATIDFLAELYGMKNIHGYSVKYKNVGIFGAGGAVGFNISEKELFNTLEKGSKRLDAEGVKKKIMVTHMHAKDTKAEFSGIPGSKSIKEIIKKLQPDIFIHSHIHEAEGIEDRIGKTKIFSVGKKGRIFEI